MHKRFKVVLTSQIHDNCVKLLEQECEVAYVRKPLNLITSEDLIEIGREADAFILVTNVERFTGKVIEALPKLKIIARHGVGFDNVDVKKASEKGIYVTTAPVLEETVADQAFALLLCLSRKICKGHSYIVSKKWKIRDPTKFRGVDVWGKTAGIIGLGRIGCRIAERAKGFKMRVLYYDIVRNLDFEERLNVKYKPLIEMLSESEIVFIAVPLNNNTRGMVGKEEFAIMNPSTLIINVARGPIVDHDSLVYVLREGKLAGAGIDVFDQEPLPLDDPLLYLDNVVLTPHMAANTIECRKRMAEAVAEEVLRVLKGKEPRYAVNSQIKRHR